MHITRHEFKKSQAIVGARQFTLAANHIGAYVKPMRCKAMTA